jgi:microcystin-dependent protein
MSQPFLGEIKIVSFNFAPQGWALCNGQLLPINQHQALFSLFGTMYGGDGQTTFALPDFRGRVPLHFGSGFSEGQRGGEAAHTITTSEMPQHIHFAQGTSNAAAVPNPSGNVWASGGQQVYFDPPANLVTLAPGAVTAVGGNQAHENLSPYLVLTFIVALQGIFPSPN